MTTNSALFHWRLSSRKITTPATMSVMTVLPPIAVRSRPASCQKPETRSYWPAIDLKTARSNTCESAGPSSVSVAMSAISMNAQNAPTPSNTAKIGSQPRRAT